MSSQKLILQKQMMNNDIRTNIADSVQKNHCSVL